MDVEPRSEGRGFFLHQSDRRQPRTRPRPYLCRRMNVWLRLGLLLWIQVHLVSPELVKLPMLFVHYADHLQQQDELSFADYLGHHYTDEAHEESDHPGHGALPFHHHHHGVVADHCSTKVLTSDPLAVVNFPEAAADRDRPLPVAGRLLCGHVGSLLRPPRVLA